MAKARSGITDSDAFRRCLVERDKVIPVGFTPMRNGRQRDLFDRLARCAYRASFEAEAFGSRTEACKICAPPISPCRLADPRNRYAFLVVCRHHCQHGRSAVRSVVLVDGRILHNVASYCTCWSGRKERIYRQKNSCLSQLTRLFFRERAHNSSKETARADQVHLHGGYRSILHFGDLRNRIIVQIKEIDDGAFGFGQSIQRAFE